MKIPSRPVLVFLLAFAPQSRSHSSPSHAWEDYWITFRTSRNLAEGHGLVFNAGDRLHTFTSPLGVLLPAVPRPARIVIRIDSGAIMTRDWTAWAKLVFR